LRKEAREAALNESNGSDSEEDISDIKKAYTIDDITNDLDKTLKISKNKKKKKTSVEQMEITKVIKKPEKNSKNKMLKEKGKNKRSRS